MKRNTKLLMIFVFLLLCMGGFFVFGNFFNRSEKREIQIKNSQEEVAKNFKTGKTENETDGLAETGVFENEEADEAENGKSYGKETEDEEKSVSDAEKNENNLKIISKPVSWGYQRSSGRSVDTIIIHSSYNALGGDEYNTAKLIDEYKKYNVSPHYLIDRKGNIYKLVRNEDIAYHAGESKTPDGRKNVNNFSIGVEMMNTKSDKCTSYQYNSLKHLLAYLNNEFEIKYMLGHSDIAKGRKDDPWNFDWNKIK